MKARSIALGTAVLGSVFVVGPVGVMRLNAALGWPRWQSAAGRVAGGTLMCCGIALAAHCSQLFVRRGGGTPVPTEPPHRLVLAGPYRFSRNPMYVADATILLGLFVHRGELALLLYTGLFIMAAHAWIVGREEPQLVDRFGEAYRRYLQSVPRWIAIPAFHRGRSQ
jgi:protein-S-isoprenylcysteine O-methyltransferase Ste14